MHEPITRSRTSTSMLSVQLDSQQESQNFKPKGSSLMYSKMGTQNNVNITVLHLMERGLRVQSVQTDNNEQTFI